MVFSLCLPLLGPVACHSPLAAICLWLFCSGAHAALPSRLLWEAGFVWRSRLALVLDVKVRDKKGEPLSSLIRLCVTNGPCQPLHSPPRALLLATLLFSSNTVVKCNLGDRGLIIHPTATLSIRLHPPHCLFTSPPRFRLPPPLHLYTSSSLQQAI